MIGFRMQEFGANAQAHSLLPTRLGYPFSGRHARFVIALAAWLGPQHLGLIPFTSFAENELRPDGSRPPVWFAFNENRPLAFFAGIWACWTSVRKLKEGEVTAEGLFAGDPPRSNSVAKLVSPHLPRIASGGEA
jgi:hypothetical protein